MKTLLITLLLTLAANAYAVTAFYTGQMRYITTVTYQSGVSCQYRYAGNTFWRTFALSYCPSSVTVY